MEEQKAETTAILEESFGEIVSLHKQVTLLNTAVQNLDGNLTIVQQNLNGWVKHLEEIFSQGVVVQVMQKELEKLIAVRSELEEITKEVKTNFQLIAKPQKRWFEFWR